MDRDIQPPLLPNVLYTPYYCEENIFLLAEHFLRQDLVPLTWDVYVVFISNHTQTVAVWNQRVSPSPELPIVWDYHVVLVLKSRRTKISSSANLDGQTWVYDLDTLLNVPCSWKEYTDKTFLDEDSILPRYHSLFRVIPAKGFLDHFASDRSHMLKTNSSEVPPCYHHCPPAYPALRGPKAVEGGVVNNLMSHFVSMAPSLGVYGTVMNLDEFVRWCLETPLITFD
ncbi:hypothetical protein CONPUDRAFT_117353 [Coniophora puteana RWD-64-598 SS2]|uniref:Protein N-terminal glutamine amidohydrolase n=1 Tax=Coniophora puteana (strain RWD-64-598) TaxID=741705 RepID=A0A5M3N273_CONPW|nr:uncharacterized protein CONPUDRAFT_117353 [Coniophora puteana RWD-64-598 SS2]EIW84991.1 hypothetical protein CONPUDRAFT_117353 [Coniophora puteana RWD-64-598 SS2]